MDRQCADLLDILDKIRKGGADKTRTSLDATISRVTWWFRGLSLLITLSMLVFGLVISRIRPLEYFWMEIIGWIGMLAMLLALFGLLLDMLPQLIELIRFRKVALRQFKLEIQYDLWQVAELMDIPTQTLEHVQRYLELKIERSKHRILMFIGGPEKLALFSLACLGYSFSKQLPLNSTMWGNSWFRYSLGFLAGIMLGGILLNAVVQRYIYHRELIQLALEYQSINQRLHRFYNMPTLPFKEALRPRCSKVLAFCRI
ncbi:hypothetical protein QN379_22470 [Glaciimonas sp. Gout2]|uniref:hypothetical protein n=1 Tax=unclassified Glaciimonas TaxID=2644401 RepID=UPI002B2340A1|nr:MULTISPECIES: hypothetical protein [unclassified Glaciimonas]MEB0010312.1 hypothetical protein [Glaciimonas sp. Cout2]MEB0084777.1 hypothetical protein [Glaciimonas sp. Gout2]